VAPGGGGVGGVEVGGGGHEGSFVREDDVVGDGALESEVPRGESRTTI